MMTRISDREGQMPGRIEGAVAVITGGAGGIGEGTARRFVAEGARCVIADIQDDAGARVADEIGARYVHCDVASEDDVAACIDAAVGRFGRLDCMFNNAGILGAIGPITEIDATAWHRSLDVLLSSVFFGIKHAARAMMRQGSGVILNTTSTAGVRAGLGPHVYTAAKHAVVGLTQSVAPELGRHGIRVNAIAPGGTVTALTAYVTTGDAANLEEAQTKVGRTAPLGRPGAVDDIANAALYLASDEAAYVSGAVLVVDGAAEVIGDRAGRFVDMGAAMVREAGRPG
jgi:NAD(P)-dependent dehydrogenase (short-subunit alcohol dehydrogenase family)